MRVLNLYVTGRLSETPSTTRGFTALAYDIVYWWDARTMKCVRTSDFVELRAHVIAALSGQHGGALRPIRPSHRRETKISLDDLRTILLSRETTSVRIRRIQQRLHHYQRKGLIAAPVIDSPAALHVSHCDGNNAAVSTITPIVSRGGSDAAKELGRLLGDVAKRCEGAEMVVFFDDVQEHYVSTVAGSDVISCLCPGTPRLHLRRFVAKEKLGPGMPIRLLAAHLKAARIESDLVSRHNFAHQMARMSSELGVLDLIPGLCKACHLTVQETIERGVRFRCARLVSLQTGGVPEHRAKRNGMEASIAVQGGHVIEPSCTLVTRALAIVDFASLYPSIIAAKGVGGHLGLPNIVLDLMHKRRSCDDAGLARACKLVANSVYGQLASPTSPIFDPAAANAITSAGRSYLQALVDHLHAQGGRVVYGDTDSCMAVFDDNSSAEACAKKVEECIGSFNASLPDPMKVAVQDIFTRSVFLSKKKYIGVGRSGTLHFIGTYNRRSDSPEVACEEYERLACQLFRDDCTEEDVLASLTRSRERFQGADARAFSARRKLTSISKGDACGSAAPHINLAWRENCREDGFAYTEEDSIEFVPCIPTRFSPTSDHRAASVYEGVDYAAECTVDRGAVWRSYISAAIPLISAVQGPLVASSARVACANEIW